MGGCGNNDGGFPYSGIFACGLTTSTSPATMGVPSAFWVDELIANCIPVITSAISPIYLGLPNGALYTTGIVGSGFMGRPVYVK